MKLTKNTRLSKKPFKALDGATIGSAIGSSVGESASKSAGNEVKKSMGSGMSPTSFDYSNLATTGMAMGVGAIENQQAQLASVNKAPSLSGEMGKGALKGAGYIAPVALNPAMLAATGGLSALAVPVAAGIGAGVNYVTGNKKINAFNSAKETSRKNFLSSQESFAKQNSQYNMLDAVNRGYSTQGSNMSSFYKNGGVVYKQGGSLNPISSDTKLAVGRSHEQGGIKMSSDAEIEGGETVVDKGDHTLVVSDNLVNPITGRTFAKDDLRLAKLARKYEGATTQLAKNSLKHIQAKREALHGLQQQMNGDASDMNTAQNGGKLRPINILTKPVKTTPRPSTHLAKDGMKLYGNGGEITDEEIAQIAEYEEQNKGGKGGGSNWGTNDPSIKTKEDAVKYYKEKYLPMVKDFPEALKKRALQQAINTGDPFGIALTASGYYDEKGTPSKESGLKDSRAVNRGLKMNQSIYNKRLANIKAQYEKDPEGFTQRFDKAVDYHYANATQKGSKTPLNKAYPNFYEGYTKLVRTDNAKKGTDPIDFSAVAINNNTTLPGVNAPATVSPVTQTQVTPTTNTQPSTLKGDSTGKNLRKAWDKTKEVGEAALPTLSRAGKLAQYMAPGVFDFMNHEANKKLQEKIPVPKMQNQGFTSYAKQSAEPMIAAVKKQQADYNAGIVGSLADSQTAALMKANMAAKAGDSIADIKMKVSNINSEIANKQTDINLGIQKANYANDYDYEANVVAKKIGIGNYGAENKSRLLENVRAVQNTDREERHTDMDTAIKMAGLEDRGREYLRRIGASPEGFYTGKGLYAKNGGRLNKLTKLRR